MPVCMRCGLRTRQASDDSRVVVGEVETGEQVVQHLLDERQSPVLEVLRALEHVAHVLDILGVVAVQLGQRLLVAFARRLLLLTTSLHLLLQLLHLHAARFTTHLTIYHKTV